MSGRECLIASLLYGLGLRLLEAMRLRVKDIDFGASRLVVREGKGGKDRVTMLPVRLKHGLGDWHCESIPNAKACIQYLAPYVFKVAVSDQRILRVDDHGVCLRWRKVGSQRLRTLRLAGIEFLRRFLNHVLPKGFR